MIGTPSSRASGRDAGPVSAARVAITVLEDLVLVAVARTAPMLGTAREPIVSALSALDRMAAPGLRSAEGLEHLDRALAALEALRSSIDSFHASPDLERARSAVAGMVHALAATRADAIEAALIEQKRAPAPGAPQHGSPPPMVASAGFPRFHVLQAAEGSWTAVLPDLVDEDPRDEEELALEESAIRDADSDPFEGEPSGEEVSIDSEVDTMATLEDLGRGPGAERQDPPEGLDGLARRALEEIAAVGLLRRGREAVTTLAALARFDERLLASFDALAGLSLATLRRNGERDEDWELARFDVVGAVHRYAGAAFVPDPYRAFVRGFVTSSVDGPGISRAALIALRHSYSSTLEAQVDALILAANPGVGAAVARLLGRTSPPVVRAALLVLRARREVELAQVAAFLSHPDALVRAAAARAVGVAAGSSAAALLHDALSREADATVCAAAAMSLLELGDVRGLAIARAGLEPTPERLVAAASARSYENILGVAGDPGDAPMLERAFERDAGAAEAMGWFGAGAHVDLLIANLDRGEEARRPRNLLGSVERALIRLTGIDAETDCEASGGARTQWWRRAWAEQRGHIDLSMRIRRGRPFRPESALDELEQPLTFRERETAVLETSVLFRTTTIEPAGWVAAQRSAIARLRAELAANAKFPRPLDKRGWLALSRYSGPG